MEQGKQIRGKLEMVSPGIIKKEITFLKKCKMLKLSSQQQTKHYELLTAAIAGGAALAGAAGQMYSNSKMNKRSEKYNWEMYKTQRHDALADWQMQNAYNSPQAQMQRLKEAGLNPNLVYGNGVEGNSASQARSADVKQWNPQSMPVAQGVGDTIAAFQDARMRSAQINNVMTANELQKKDLEIKDLQKAALAVGIDKARFGYDLSVETRSLGIDYLKKRNEQIDQMNLKSMADIDLNAGRYNLEVAKNKQSIDNMMEQIRASQSGRELNLAQMAKIRQETQNLAKTGDILQFQKNVEETLSKAGLKSSDNFLIKILAMAAEKFGRSK